MNVLEMDHSFFILLALTMGLLLFLVQQVLVPKSRLLLVRNRLLAMLVLSVQNLEEAAILLNIALPTSTPSSENSLEEFFLHHDDLLELIEPVLINCHQDNLKPLQRQHQSLNQKLAILLEHYQTMVIAYNDRMQSKPHNLLAQLTHQTMFPRLTSKVVRF